MCMGVHCTMYCARDTCILYSVHPLLTRIFRHRSRILNSLYICESFMSPLPISYGHSK